MVCYYAARANEYEPAGLEAALYRAGFDEIEVVTTERFFLLASACRRWDVLPQYHPG